jgi:hypothetical protein
MSGDELIGTIRKCIEWAALGIETLGALVIVAGVLRVAITRGTVVPSRDRHRAAER